VAKAVLVVAALGFLAFGALFGLSFASPITLESWARVAIQSEIELRLTSEAESLNQSSLLRAAERAVGANNRELAATQQLLAKLPASVAAVSGQMLEPGCPCRQRLREAVRGGLTERSTVLAAANERLTALVESKYAEVAHALLSEVRIFSGANALVFVVLGVLAVARRRSGLQLLAPALVLVGAAAVVACLYIFSQHWLQTVLLGNYVGFWYFPYLAAAIGLLADVAFNRARVATSVVNGVTTALGGVASAVPC
jgi:hypothetical protein